jgi:hypothetical protein
VIASRKSSSPLGRARRHHHPERLDCRGLAPSELLGEPSRHRHVRERRHALVADHADALGPHLDRSDTGGRVGDGQTADAVGRVHAEPHRGDTAERDAADVGGVDPLGIEDRERVAAELLDGVIAGRR